MIKQFILGAAVLSTTVATKAQEKKPFELTGTITKANSAYIYLSYMNAAGESILDSAKTATGKFLFRGFLTEPTRAIILNKNGNVVMGDPNLRILFLEPGKMSLELEGGNFAYSKLKGSVTQDQISQLELQKAGINKQRKPISEAYEIASEAYRQASKDKKPEAEVEALKDKAELIRNQFAPFNKKLHAIDMAFIRQNPNAFYSGYLLRHLSSSLSLDTLLSYNALLSASVKSSKFGKELQEEIKNLQGGSPGAMASTFARTDINGETLSLADFRGKKYVLLDFWASWCVPCRKGNPHLLELHKKYKEKGFEIIGISDDDSNHDAWRKAVAQDGIGVWKHVLRGLKRTTTGYDRSESISEPYGIHSLPTKILIDKTGTIIGRYGGGGEDDAAMDKKLKEIFEQ